MKKRLLLLLFVFCHLILFGKDKKTPSLFIDSSVENLHLSETQMSPKSFHLFSHGKSGELFIENRWMNAEEISKKFKSQLTGKTELYIYGCNFASGEKGRNAIAFLEKSLRVKVSASDDITGADGDWDLEVGHGKNALSMENYQHNLQLDTTHYLNPIVCPNYGTNTIAEEYLYLSTPSTSPISVQMTYPAGVGSPRVSVTNLTTSAVTIVTNGVLQLDNANPIRVRFVTPTNTVLPVGTTPTTLAMTEAGTIIPGTAQGLKFTSTNQFYLNYRAQSSIQAGTVLTKGTTALGKDFRWGGTPIELTTTIADIGNMLSIMAVADNTTVNISDIKPGTEFLNGSNPTPITGTVISRVLNKGESFILYAPVKTGTASAQDDGWLGAKITASENVSVLVGGLLQQGGTGNNRDIGFDQLLPVTYTGFEHIIMRGNGGNAEKVVVVATNGATNIYANGAATPIATINAGSTYAIVNASYFINNNMFIRTDKPVYVFHKIYGSSATNTNNLMFIPPLSCTGEKIVDLIPDANRIGTTVYTGTELVVLAASGAVNVPVATLNGTPLVPTVSGGAVTGNPNWLSYRYPVATTGNIKVTSAGTIQAQIFGANNAAGYGGYYSGFGSTLTVAITSDSPYPYSCTGQSTLSAPSGLGTYQWYKDGVAIPGATSNSYTLTPAADPLPASYYVVVVFPGGCIAYSNTINTQICPCAKLPTSGTPDSYTKLGISSRDARTTENWPQDIANGFLTLESDSKGFVVTRMSSPETQIAVPVIGMLVYDTDDFCLKLYNGTTWNCIQQTCNN